ncbi:hypothetical protein PHYBLDRAFT_171682 [Phycomyces blakesleeanus NRRL 1555(-)]|uniref:Uncharacterized protein n=1 Tax=Phycomyces blakesleeanus (strain ATCC 8743b / DSM 1359 / FGSC 10004 / NBRC 33097 / NRRL 1555) TaxID=763407 RepID=A0A167LEX0_PHYB8|nr:hypothetical protein PHYBLDRAFT_171682 [Phycomyces blakesleeanus NRRL 1555(-)]OAD70299.1 hypothetical protein PHYBLDRAFT_171682 [Phycomyces blakesleeanus NRRL 1555(-)]|eukprot:XP_018288339.1 hypothetical protein PHYBLDRAFT_171682 [Phycomyces blakesleeanus NRRL 1555(-)]
MNYPCSPKRMKLYELLVRSGRNIVKNVGEQNLQMPEHIWCGQALEKKRFSGASPLATTVSISLLGNYKYSNSLKKYGILLKSCLKSFIFMFSKLNISGLKRLGARLSTIKQLNVLLAI